MILGNSFSHQARLDSGQRKWGLGMRSSRKPPDWLSNDHSLVMHFWKSSISVPIRLVIKLLVFIVKDCLFSRLTHIWGMGDERIEQVIVPKISLLLLRFSYFINIFSQIIARLCFISTILNKFTMTILSVLFFNLLRWWFCEVLICYSQW